jgi:hypothetical protein
MFPIPLILNYGLTQYLPRLKEINIHLKLSSILNLGLESDLSGSGLLVGI